jgi:ABC-type branched-subunit amino acid transport system substrate-binding protein
VTLAKTETSENKEAEGGEMKHLWKIATVSILIAAMLVVTPLVSCGGGGGGKKTITIGVITDLTGAASPALVPLQTALQDLVRYVNEDDPISGVKLSLAVWDDRMDSSRDIPGYDWLKERGAQVIINPIDYVASILKPFAEMDKVPVFSLSSSEPLIEPPGWVFCANSLMYQNVLTIAQWIGDHWDYTKGVPKIGCIALDASGSAETEQKLKEYCQNNPDKFDYVDGFLVSFASTTFSGQVDKLKNCDWIAFPGTDGISMLSFIEQFRAKGYTAKFFSQETLPSFWGLMVDTLGYETIDGWLCGIPAGWWSDTSPVVGTLKSILQKYHPSDADKIIHEGEGYIGGGVQMYFMLQILRQAIEQVGAENFDGQAFYNTAVNFKITMEGYPEWGYSETKRVCLDQMKIYGISAEAKDLVAVSGLVPIMQQ